ncbi:hypothetical protein [Novosphingobium album (ex Liu et al. 2023)]|uniref:Uncharacterized protein n=1 Tax=Novosphingobium album (ex Liu et al. 2023) TaxID=3031130 RepID=A0ABT5WPH0_9SPHN|nr:hypothetical protein [Novosphingobium album (ex Liu et al. 2023)]MDE8651177.1 hypothetical protein [Novosphingobium album (ex Liu et al. 2023)]
MVQLIEANWLIFILALLIGIAVAWWLFARGSKGVPRDRRPDVLDEGAAPAQRNQALIDAPSAAAEALMPMAGAGTMAGIGEIIAVAAQEEVEEAEARRLDAEEAAAAQPAPPPPPAPEPAPEPAGTADDLLKLKGVGPKLVALLHGLGITSYAQIAAWSEADIDRIDAGMGAFTGRIRRDNWVEQARLLASGDTGAYEAKFGKL